MLMLDARCQHIEAMYVMQLLAVPSTTKYEVPVPSTNKCQRTGHHRQSSARASGDNDSVVKRMMMNARIMRSLFFFTKNFSYDIAAILANKRQHVCHFIRIACKRDGRVLGAGLEEHHSRQSIEVERDEAGHVVQRGVHARKHELVARLGIG